MKNILKASILSSLVLATVLQLNQHTNPVFAATLTGTISASPASGSYSVGTPFNVTIVADGGGQAFNAVQSTVTVTGLTVQSVDPGNCNFGAVTQAPTTSDPSFSAAILSGSSTNCNTYVLSVVGNSAGNGTIAFSGESMTAFSDSSEMFKSATNGSYTVAAASPTPTPTSTPVPTTTKSATVTPSTLPQTGSDNFTLLALGMMIALFAGLGFVQVRLYRKENR